MGKLFQDHIEEGKALKLSRKQLRKSFSALGALLDEVNEGLIFEALGMFQGIELLFVCSLCPCYDLCVIDTCVTYFIARAD